MVQCPKCQKIQKATGNHYFLCCGSRWDIEKNRFQAEESQYNGHQQSNTKQAKTNGKSENQSKSNDKSRPNRDDNEGNELNIV